MKKRIPTFDCKCHELAAAFLADEPSINTPANIFDLATEIQQTIEDYIADKFRIAANKRFDKLLHEVQQS